MASRKDLKKTVKNLCGELVADLVMLSACKDANHEEINRLVNEVAKLYNEFVTRLSHAGKGSEKLFYKKYRDEFTNRFNTLAEEIIKC